MNYVYILKNPLTGKHYIGSTINLERRIKQHIFGNTRTTRRLKTDTLVYTEQFNTIDEARIREKQLKSYKSGKYLEKLIKMGR